MSSKTNKTDVRFWDQKRKRIYSRTGGWIVGKGVFSHDHSIMDDLVGRVSYMQVVVLNATGHLPERRLGDWLEAFHICLSWPDPRIWCNQIGALGGTLRTSAVAATVMGILASDSHMYGIRPLIDGVNFIQGALREHKAGKSPEEIVQAEVRRQRGKVRIMGYARPIASGDERVPALERVTRNLRFPVGEHLSLAYQIEEVLVDQFDESMNINGYASAFLSDRGFTATDVYQVSSVLVASGVTACYADTRDRPPESFLPWRCDDVDYQGKPPREVPDD